MNVLDMIKRVLDFQDWKAASSLPGWRSRPTRKKKDRTPFAGRNRHAAPCNMEIEEFADKEKRNERYSQLKSKGTFGISKFSTVKDNKSIWCVARPR